MIGRRVIVLKLVRVSRRSGSRQRTVVASDDIYCAAHKTHQLIPTEIILSGHFKCVVVFRGLLGGM